MCFQALPSFFPDQAWAKPLQIHPTGHAQRRPAARRASRPHILSTRRLNLERRNEKTRGAGKSQIDYPALHNLLLAARADYNADRQIFVYELSPFTAICMTMNG
jgi:hypothetical protein